MTYPSLSWNKVLCIRNTYTDNKVSLSNRQLKILNTKYKEVTVKLNSFNNSVYTSLVNWFNSIKSKPSNKLQWLCTFKINAPIHWYSIFMQIFYPPTTLLTFYKAFRGAKLLQIYSIFKQRSDNWGPLYQGYLNLTPTLHNYNVRKKKKIWIIKVKKYCLHSIIFLYSIVSYFFKYI